jgi:Tol biopolymer transport system component
VDGSGTAEQLAAAPQNQVPGSFSPDGRVLAFSETGPNEGWDIWMLPFGGEGEREPQPFLRTTYNEQMPMFSPNGRWLAYVSDESGRNEVYIQPYPGPGAKLQISTEGGTQPVWASSGRELFYLSRDRKIMSVPLDLDGDFQAGVPRLRVPASIASSSYLDFAQYDVMPDGQSFIVIRENDTYTALRELRVVLNWFDELKRLVPTEN